MQQTQNGDNYYLVTGFDFSGYKQFNELPQAEQDYYNSFSIEELEDCNEEFKLSWWLRLRIKFKSLLRRYI